RTDVSLNTSAGVLRAREKVPRVAIVNSTTIVKKMRSGERLYMTFPLKYCISGNLNSFTMRYFADDLVSE
ncbi:MAG: hypothetical protein DRN53_07580, partial [Thermoprotei archaeon]